MMDKFLWFYRLALLAILGMLGYDVYTQNVTGFTYAYPFLFAYTNIRRQGFVIEGG